MADSQKFTKEKSMLHINRESMLMCITSKEIIDAVNELLTIAHNAKQEKDRLSAIRTILEYTVAKPKQDIGISQSDDTLAGIKVEIVKKQDEPEPTGENITHPSN